MASRDILPKHHLVARGYEHCIRTLKSYINNEYYQSQ